MDANPSVKIQTDNQVLFQKALLNVTSNLLAAVVLAGLAWQSGNWQVTVIAIVTGIMAAAGIAGLYLTRNRRSPVLGRLAYRHWAVGGHNGNQRIDRQSGSGARVL
jgi:hypothetical protein